MEALIAEELDEIVSRMKTNVLQNDGKYLVDSKYYSLSTVNILWCLITGGDRFSHDDVKLMSFLRTVDKFNAAAALNNITITYPVLATLFPEWTGWNKNAIMFQELYAFMEVS